MALLATSVLLKENGEKILLESGDQLVLEQSYQGFDVLDYWPNWESLPREFRAYSGTVLDNTTGLAVVKPRADQPRQAMQVAFRFTSRAELARFRRFVDRIRGRQKAFWMPTWQQDLVATVDCSTTSLVVESVGYTGRMFPNNARKHLALVNYDRSIYLRGVSGASDNGTTETLTLDAAPDATVTAGKSLICFLLLVRLQIDAVELTYISPEHMEATVQVLEVPLEVPAP